MHNSHHSPEWHHQCLSLGQLIISQLEMAHYTSQNIKYDTLGYDTIQ